MSSVISVLIKGDADPLRRELGQADSSLSRFGNQARNLAASLGLAFGAVEIARFGADAVMAGSDYVETLDKMRIVTGEAAAEIEAFADTAATSLGMSETSALDAAATFAMFGKTAGLSGDDLADFSTDFVALAADMASFNNTSPEQAIEAIGAALRGEMEPLRQFNVVLDDATLRAKALEMGIYSGTGALTAQQRTLAATAALFELTADQQGNFTQTMGGTAGQLKILQAQFEDFKVQIGLKLLPLVNRLVVWINAELIPALAELGDWWDANGATVQLWAQRVWSVVKPLLDGLLAAFRFFGAVLSGDWQAAWNAIVDFLAAALANARALMDLGWAAMRYVVETAMGAIRSLIEAGWSAIQGAMSAALGALQSAVSAAFNAMLAPVQWVIDKIQALIDKVRAAASAIASLNPFGGGGGTADALIDAATGGGRSVAFGGGFKGSPAGGMVINLAPRMVLPNGREIALLVEEESWTQGGLNIRIRGRG